MIDVYICIFSRFDFLVDFLTVLFSKFLVNGGLSKDEVTTKDLLDVNVRDKKIQLPLKDMYVGPKVEQFIEKLGFTRSSPELGFFFELVQTLYITAGEKAKKY